MDRSINNLPEGQILRDYPSPDGDFTVRVYRTEGDATVDFAVRAAITYNKLLGFTRNIYWQYHSQDAAVKWIDSQTVDINGVILNAWRDSYDWRYARERHN